jgi:uncharacterized caspase-like protein
MIRHRGFSAIFRLSLWGDIIMRPAVRSGIALVCAFAFLGAGPADAEKRVALIVGNAAYGHHAQLANVPNDAAAIAALFKAAQFDAVELRHNLGVVELRRALREFSRHAAEADVAVVFYAGHGIEVGQVNYLVPVDARLTTDFDVDDEAVPLDRVLQAMEHARRLRLVLLDACRENPFVGSMKRTSATRSVGRGLARIEPASTNTLIAYATRPNAVAEDGKGPNSPFTAALARHLLTPGLDLRIALGHVRDEVLASTGHKQEPYVTGSLGGGIVSVAAASATLEPVPLAPSKDAEEAQRLKMEMLAREEELRKARADAQAARADAKLAEQRRQEALALAAKVAVLPKPEPPRAEAPKPDAPSAGGSLNGTWTIKWTVSSGCTKAPAAAAPIPYLRSPGRSAATRAACPGRSPTRAPYTGPFRRRWVTARGSTARGRFAAKEAPGPAAEILAGASSGSRPSATRLAVQGPSPGVLRNPLAAMRIGRSVPWSVSPGSGAPADASLAGCCCSSTPVVSQSGSGEPI